VDELAPNLSGSRVRSIANAVRSLYRWAQDRDLADHDPASLLRLPAMDARPIDRVASPAEFAQLLDALPVDIALPYALAGYGMGRRAQIIRLRWPEVDLDVGAIEWGRRMGSTQVRRVASRCADRRASACPSQAVLSGAGSAEARTRLSTPRALGTVRLAQQWLACDTSA